MTDLNKIRGKALQKQIREKRIQNLLNQMPISVDELRKLVDLIQSEGCDNTLKSTQVFLKDHENSQTIIAWFNQHGGYCDCEVIMNVVDGYLHELEIIPPEVVPDETQVQAMFSRKFTKSENLNPVKGPLNTNFINLEKIPSPWKLFLNSNPEMLDKAHLCFGSKGMRSECKLSYYECSPIITPTSIDLSKLWETITGFSPTYPIELDNDIIALQNGELIGTIISQLGYDSIFGCYALNNSSSWHFVFTSTLTRKKGDLAEIKKLLNEVYLK